MQKINFQDLPNTTTPINATNLNQVQTNVENVFNGTESMGSAVASNMTVSDSLNCNAYVGSDFTSTWYSVVGNGLKTIRKSGTWTSTYFPNYSTGLACNKDQQGGFIIFNPSSPEVNVGGVSSNVVTWTDKCLLNSQTNISDWTPTISASSETAPTVTYTARRGKYCRLGNIIFFDFYIRAKITALNGTNNYAVITGLPVSAVDHGFGAKACTIGTLYSAVNNSTNNVFVIQNSGIKIQSYYGANSAKWVVTSTNYMEVAGSGWYFVS